MNSLPATVVFAVSLGLSAFAQNLAAPADGALQPPPKPNEEMVKWIATVDQQWQATYAQEVTAAFDAEKAMLAQQFAAGLEANFAKASGAENLDLTLLWRNERDRFASEKSVPSADEADTPAELKQLRATWRAQMPRLEKERAARAKSVHTRYDQVLAQAQTQLTQKQRFEDALLVKRKRDEIAAAWFPAPAEAPANPPAPATAEVTGDPAAILIGTWRVTNPQNGWTGTRTFKSDGTFTTDSGGGLGKWEIAGDKISVAYADGSRDQILLPLDPTGTKWMISRGRTVSAVKEKSAAMGAATSTTKPPLGTASTSTSTDASVAAVKALISNSRWEWFDGGQEFKGKAYWGEFYRDGTSRMQWNRTPTWEVLPPNILHIFDPADKRHWYFDVDVAKKIALKNPQLDKNNNSMRYDKKVSMPSARERGK